MTDDKVGTLGDEAVKRKERLKALKRKQDESGSKSNEKSLPLSKPKFRSYVPKDEALKDIMIEPAKPGNVEAEIQEQLDSAKTRVVIDDLDITTLAPRKPDWDLKRDVSKKLEKLERRTQKAIAQLIRERLKIEQSDLATKVAIGARAEMDDDDDG